MGDVLRRPVTGEEATAQAGQRLSLMLAGLAGIGVLSAAISKVLAPLQAMEKAVRRPSVR